MLYRRPAHKHSWHSHPVNCNVDSSHQTSTSIQQLVYTDFALKLLPTTWCGDTAHFATVEPTMPFYLINSPHGTTLHQQHAIQWCEVMLFFQIHSQDLHQTAPDTLIQSRDAPNSGFRLFVRIRIVLWTIWPNTNTNSWMTRNLVILLININNISAKWCQKIVMIKQIPCSMQ